MVIQKGPVIEIYGQESSGKNNSALHAVAQAQEEGGIAAFIDAEHALDPSCGALGVQYRRTSLVSTRLREQDLKFAGSQSTLVRLIWWLSTLFATLIFRCKSMEISGIATLVCKRG